MDVCLAYITGFARACGRKSDIEMFNVLNKFYSLIGNVIGKANGTAVKYMGDCALVVFPEEQAREGIDSLRKLSSLADEIWSEFDEKCTVRIKAHVGSIAIGPMGQDQRLDVIGNTLNQLFLMPWDSPELSDELKQLLEQ